jgi:anti-anti-sigma factor
VAVHRCDGIVEVHLDGELDTATAPQLAAELRALLDGSDTPPQVVVDAGRLRFADVSGLDPLVETARRLGPSGGFRMRNVSGFQLRMIRILRLADLLGVEA